MGVAVAVGVSPVTSPVAGRFLPFAEPVEEGAVAPVDRERYGTLGGVTPMPFGDDSCSILPILA
jgi:hypothetical protein